MRQGEWSEWSGYLSSCDIVPEVVYQRQDRGRYILVSNREYYAVARAVAHVAALPGHKEAFVQCPRPFGRGTEGSAGRTVARNADVCLVIGLVAIPGSDT